MDVETIVKGLSEDQRAALRSGKWNSDPICCQLMLAGIVIKAPTVAWPYYVELTPLGLAVRAALKEPTP